MNEREEKTMRQMIERRARNNTSRNIGMDRRSTYSSAGQTKRSEKE